MAWVEKDHSAHLIPTPCYVQGRQPAAQAAQSHIQPGVIEFYVISLSLLVLPTFVHAFEEIIFCFIFESPTGELREV